MINDAYLYSTKLYANPLNLKTGSREININTFPNNENLQTVVLRDLKLAYGMAYEVDFLQKLTALRIFVVEINDLRGSDRLSFPRMILQMIVALSHLARLEVLEIGQRPGHTSCFFEDSDIEPD